MLEKRVVLIFLCCFLVFSHETHSEIQIQSIPNPAGLNINIQLLSDIKIGHEIVDNTSFCRLEIEDMGVSGSEGYPEIPVFRRLIEVPANIKDINVRYESISSQEEIKVDYLLYPIQPPWEKIVGKEKPKFVFYSYAYEAGREYGREKITVRPFGIVRGKNLYEISYYPVHYIPAENKILINRDIKIFIQWDNTKSINMRDIKYTSRYVDDLWKPFIVNNLFDVDKEKAENYTIPVGMLVIVGSNFSGSSKLNEWVQWKTQRGFVTTVVNVADIGMNSTAIKNYIKQAYANWEIPPSFVVLVGDANYIPAQAGYAYNNPITDLYYSIVDGDEYYTPDLWVGRISVSTLSELNNALTKILKYEKATWTLNEPWYIKASFLAGVDHSNVTEGTHNYVIDNYFEPKEFITQKLYTVTYGATTSDVLSAINEGRGWIIYSGHGSEYIWQDGPEVTQDNLRSLTNTVYPWVLSFACDTGHFGRPECFGETWQRVSGGGIGFFGSSVTSYWDEDDILERKIIESFFENKTWTAGMILAGKLKFFNHYGNTDKTRRYFEMYNILGDPSTEVWTGILQNPKITHDIRVSPNGLPLSLYIEWANASATLAHLTTLFGAGLTNFGNNLIPVTSPGVVPSVTLTITGNPIYPYQAELPVVAGSNGNLLWDKSIYNGSSNAVLILSDSDLAGQQSVILHVSSTSGDYEEVLLSEKEVQGLFQGTVQLTVENTQQEDGLLTIIHNGTITAEYYDEHTEEGGTQLRVAESHIDIYPPEYLQNTVSAYIRSVEIQLQTNEDCNAKIEYGLQCSVPFPNFENSISWTSEHKFLIPGLTPNTQYFYRIILTDRAGNVFVSNCLSFNTLIQPDYFTYYYQSDIVNTVPLSSHRVVFTPDNSQSKYYSCLENVTGFPRSTENATPLSLGDDSFYQLDFPLETKVLLYNVSYSKCFVGSNGYLTFTAGDNDYSESLEEHFSMPRVSLFFDDLNPGAGGTVSYKFEQDAFIVTYSQVPRYGSGEVNIQAELFYDGRIAITWLNCVSSSFIAGLSKGDGVPGDLEISDFLMYGDCKVLEGSEGWISEGEGMSFEGEGIIEGEGTIEGEGVIEGEPEGIEGEGIVEGFPEGEYIFYHSADINNDGKINLSELLRVIQFFNVGGYHCDLNNIEDGYLAGSGSYHECAPHSVDYNPQDWIISMEELLRLIQIYNRGRYYPCPGHSEDNFCF